MVSGAANRAVADLARRSSKRVDVSQYAGLRQVAKAQPGEIARQTIKREPSPVQPPPLPSPDTQGPQIGLQGLGTITTRPNESTRYEKNHPGLDVANKIGTPVRAFEGGTVVGTSRGKKQGQKGYGNFVIVKDRFGNLHRYSHLNTTWMRVGDLIQMGQTLGEMGSTGSTYSLHGGTGSHLDYRVTSAFNQYIDPFRFIKTS